MHFPDATLRSLCRKLGLASNGELPLRRVIKRFALIYLVGAIILTGAIWASISLNAQSRLDTRVEREYGRIEIARLRLTRDLSIVNSELRLIANLRSMTQYLNNGSAAELDHLAQNLLTLASTTGRYDQVRYLDAAGREVIRVNYNNGRPALVPPEQLQDKSGRYYFRDTIKLNPGEVYVSPLDLNIEQDRLEIPYKPMLRFGMPLFDRGGNRKGILMFNYLGAELLQHFREAMSGGDLRHPMLLNRDGYWLSSDRGDDEWGFMLGKADRTFAHTFGEEWRTISTKDQGFILSRQGLFVYDTVYPLEAGQSSSTGAVLPQASSQRALQQHEYQWKIVSFVPHSSLTGGAFYNQTSGRLLFVLIYTIFALAAAVIAYISLSREQARTALREKERYLREITSALNEGLLVMDKNSLITFANPEACAILGYMEPELLGKAMHEHLHNCRPDDSRLLRSECNILRVMRTSANYRSNDEVFRRKDGVLLPVSVSAAPVIGQSGISGVVVAFSDISERKRGELALRRAFEEIENLYNYAPCGYHSLDANGVIVKINHTELAWLGYRREEIVGKMRFPDLLTQPSQLTFRENFHQFKEHGYVHDLEFEMLRKDGTILPILLNATAIYNSSGNYVMSRATSFDLTERKKLERMLEQQARTDALTGLANRRSFFEHAEMELARSTRHHELLSVLMLDADHFKAVNDTYGHQAGDLALQQIGEICQHTIREIDLAARLGGEEFAILLPQTAETEALEVAERLRLAVAAAPVPVEQGRELHLTISVGVATHGLQDGDLDALLKRADLAMYEAKKTGRNRVCVAGMT
ncbi:MAG TPA: diguanylate cyclase [Gallionella sp.]|nr:diguanylate cyclase [Gallionella sp.]